MRGKPRGYYGPTGERNSGIRYVPPKEQKEMAEQWQIVKEQQARITRLEAELSALAAWECESCGARFAETVRPKMLDSVTYCSSCAELSALRSYATRLAADLHTRNNQLAVAQFSLELLRDDVRLAVELLLPTAPCDALGVLVAAIKEQEATRA